MIYTVEVGLLPNGTRLRVLFRESGKQYGWKNYPRGQGPSFVDDIERWCVQGVPPVDIYPTMHLQEVR